MFQNINKIQFMEEKQLFKSPWKKKENTLINLRLDYYRYFLNELEQNQLPNTKEISKWNIIKEVLSKEITFSYNWNDKTQDIHFIPIKTTWDYIYWKIYRKSSLKINKLEEWDIQEDNIDDFPFIHIFINTSWDKSLWQKIAIQHKHHVFSNNFTLLNWFAEFLSYSLQKYWYVMNINPIPIENLFWNTINKYKTIERITLNFASQNLFNSEWDLENELKYASENFNTTNTSFEFENKWWLLTLSDKNGFLKSSVDYLEKWWWNFSIKIKWYKAEIKSKESTKTKTIDEIEINWNGTDFNKIFKI